MVTASRGDDAHPSAGRGATGLAPLLYGLIAAPAAWILGQVTDATVAFRACFPHDHPVAAHGLGGLHLFQGGVLVAALAVCCSGVLVSLSTWRRTRREHQGGGSTLLAIGEGRSRFMALCGLLTSAGFLVASAFSVAAVLFVPAC